MKNSHSKHPVISRPIVGKYARTEWSIYGTTCANIESLAKAVINGLSPKYEFTFIDAEHDKKKQHQLLQLGLKKYHRSQKNDSNAYDDQIEGRKLDVALINGNHFEAVQQIVIIDATKKESLRRRIDQLTNVQLLLVESEEAEIYDFLLPKVNTQTKKLLIGDIVGIRSYIHDEIEQGIPPLKALILTGGKSSRMGKDKSQLVYKDDLTQEERLVKLCNDLGVESYISKGFDYEGTSLLHRPVIKDRLIEMGPFGAILTAFMHDQNSAWLVLACDLPHLDKELLYQLIESRNSSMCATAVRGKESQFVEPLICIYEPKSYGRLLEFMTLGRACPRKMLINSKVEILEVEQYKIQNVNTSAEYEHLKKTMHP